MQKLKSLFIETKHTLPGMIQLLYSCEIKDLVETRLCKLCAILRSRVLRGVHFPKKGIDRQPPQY